MVNLQNSLCERDVATQTLSIFEKEMDRFWDIKGIKDMGLV